MRAAVHRWARRHPGAAATLTALILVGLALAMVSPELDLALLPEWGTGPSATEVLAVHLVVISAALVLNQVATRVGESGPAPLVTTLAGERATLLTRGSLLFATQMIFVIGTAVALGMLAWLGFRAGSVVVAALLAIGAGSLGSVIVPIVLRRYTPGGVWLTPSGITDRHLGVEVSLAWDDVESAESGAANLPVAIRTRRKRPYTLRFLAGFWKGPGRPMINAVFLDTRELGVAPASLANVVVHYARNRTERHELGTEDSLTTIATLDVDPDSTHEFLRVSSEPPKPPTYPSVPKYDDVTVRIRENEDLIEVLTRTDRALRRAGASKQERADYWDDAVSLGGDHLMATTRSWVNLVVE